MGLELGILLAERALPDIAQPEATQLFLMDDGVELAADARLRALVDAGLDATVCAMDAEARKIAPVDGVRLGSQDDHARMIASARRIVAWTGLRTECVPAGRRVVCTIVHLSKAHSALRSAVGYAAAGLEVSVVVEESARALLQHGDHPPAILRALATLRGLGRPIVGERIAADVVIAW